MSSPDRTRRPFIPVREAIVACPNSGVWNALSPELKRRYFMCYWPDEHTRRHVAMLAAFGYNALQVSVVGQMPRNAGQTMEEWVRRVKVQVAAARERGMSVTQFVWGNAISAIEPGFSDPHPIHDWHKPAEREALYREWERSARALDGEVDRVVTHWNNPGGATPGCCECSIHSAIEMHNAILDVFRGVNPHIEGYFSNWMLFPGNKSYGAGWPGYDGVQSIVGDPAFDPASGVALGIMNCGSDGVRQDRFGQLRAADLRLIRESGRKAAVWSWYLTDMEIQPALHVHTRLLQNYFRGLPAETTDALAWHTVDDCCLGLNMHNLFVAGRLMQDPSLDARALLREYAEGFFGAAAAPALVRALEAIEHARCRSLRYSLKVGDPHEGLHEEELAANELPAEWADQGLAMARSSLKELAWISLPAGHRTAWPVTLAPRAFLPELAAHLKAVEQMLAFLKAAGELRRNLKADAASHPVQAALATLPEVVCDPEHTAGLERQAYLQQRIAIENELTAAPLKGTSSHG